MEHLNAQPSSPGPSDASFPRNARDSASFEMHLTPKAVPQIEVHGEETQRCGRSGPWGGKLTAVNAAGETVGVWDKGAWNGKNSQLMYDAQQAADAKQAERDASPEAQADRDAANTPFVPKDYQTKEPLTKGPDGKWRNSKGEERDNLHGGPISATGSAMFRSLTPRPPTQESAELTAMLRIAGLR